MDPKKDMFGQPLTEGDVVAFNPPVYKGMVKGVIVKFTPQGVRVRFTRGKAWGEQETVVFQCVKGPK